MSAELTVHRDWDDDGIEDGEDLWRMDWPDIQVQLFVPYVAGKHRFEGARIFIENDVRDESGDVRVRYTCLGHPVDASTAVELLASAKDVVQGRLASEFAEVLAMPNMPECCGTHD